MPQLLTRCLQVAVAPAPVKEPSLFLDMSDTPPPALTEAAVAAAQSALGVTLPQSLKVWHTYHFDFVGATFTDGASGRGVAAGHTRGSKRWLFGALLAPGGAKLVELQSCACRLSTWHLGRRC